MNRSAQDRRSSIGKRYAAPDQAEPSGETYWARNENQRDPEFEHRYAIGNEELYDSSARANPPPPFRASDLDREQVDTGTASQTAHELSAFGEGHGDTAACRGAANGEGTATHCCARPHARASRVKLRSRTAGLNSRQVARS